ncbi:hypothetical protein NDU88_007178 [Pleurodeles waltl]|uniref:Uncharacterized protein n=1 Tax=Pleurodeles waltl TaxID=8319 RepID=A0AAV7PSS3_PLEWA|nr:hypothetical protein NDU88_007178 [Pleurodeles waltl]
MDIKMATCLLFLVLLVVDRTKQETEATATTGVAAVAPISETKADEVTVQDGAGGATSVAPIPHTKADETSLQIKDGDKGAISVAPIPHTKADETSLQIKDGDKGVTAVAPISHTEADKALLQAKDGGATAVAAISHTKADNTLLLPKDGDKGATAVAAISHTKADNTLLLPKDGDKGVTAVAPISHTEADNTSLQAKDGGRTTGRSGLPTVPGAVLLTTQEGLRAVTNKHATRATLDEMHRAKGELQEATGKAHHTAEEPRMHSVTASRSFPRSNHVIERLILPVDPQVLHTTYILLCVCAPGILLLCIILIVVTSRSK